MTTVAIQGIRGSYSEEAVGALLGHGAVIIECGDFDETFAAVESGIAENAVVPVENKIVGRIDRPLELLENGSFRIIEKLPLKVQHVLAGTAHSRIQDLVTVRSHVEALRQCRKFFAGNPHLTQIVGADTASSVRRIVETADPTSAAIGSRRAAEIYGAKILCENIADDFDNWTTFYLIGN